MKLEEKAELYHLLQRRTMTPFERRVQRMKDMEAKLFGRDAQGNPRMTGIPDIIYRARHGKQITDDEFVIINCGFTRQELAAAHRKRYEQEAKANEQK